jgi:Flp pilus assembly protein TadD/predicted Ser/Thr protein kinase
MDAEQDIIRQLVRTAIESGLTPEDVCHDRPDLLADVRQLWLRARAVEEELNALFPASVDAKGDAPADTLEPAPPRIPGYEILHVVGRGGMGVVYKAKHLSLNRIVALKVPLAGAFATPTERQRHMREARAVAALGHPNIITVHDVGEVDGQPYFTMEYIEGQTLGSKLSSTPQPARDAAILVETLAEATDRAHQAGIIHRDLKPANILLARDDTPRITDFGLARRFDGDATLTVAGFNFGTPSYMSPEQAKGWQDAPSPSVDIYSLGAILYEMLTGRPPFRAENAVETLRQVLEEDPVSPSRLNPKVPRDLETICLTCLRKEPQKRYQTSRLLAEDLHRFLRGEPIHARPAGFIERAYKSIRRRPAQAVAWGGGAVAISAVLGSLLWMASQRAAIDGAASEDLREAVRLEEARDWRGARNTLARARARLMAAGSSTDSPLHGWAVKIEEELDLIDRFNSMRLARGANPSAELSHPASWKSYREAFITSGLLHEGDTSEQFAQRVIRSSLRPALVDAMDDWAVCALSISDLEWLLKATRIADPGSPWRQRARDIEVWKNAKAMSDLAREAPVDTEPVQLLLIVAGRQLEWDAPASLVLLRKIQAAHPADFWANYALANVLDRLEDPDAIGFYRAAIAAEPSSFSAHFNLAITLDIHGKFNESIDSYLKALSLDATNWVPYYNLSHVLTQTGRHEEALDYARRCVTLAPEEATAHARVAVSLKTLNRFTEAADAFRKVLERTPHDSEQQAALAADIAACEAAAAESQPQQAPTPKQ